MKKSFENSEFKSINDKLWEMTDIRVWNKIWERVPICVLLYSQLHNAVCWELSEMYYLQLEACDE